MAIASLSFSAPLPVYQSYGANGTLFGNSTIATKGDIAINTNGTSASSGQATVLTSDLTANGLNYSAASSSVNGDKITVYYNLTGNNVASAATRETALQTLQSGDQAAALAGGFYGRGLTITPEGSQTNGNVRTTAYDISLNGPANNTFGTVNHQTGYSVSDSSDGSSLSIDNITSLGTGLKVTYELSDGPPATSTAAPIVAPDKPDPTKSLPSPLQNITTIGYLLANANGLLSSGGSARTAKLLAASLSPNSNFSSNAAVSIGDFINTSANAFPTSVPTQPASSSSNNSFGNPTSSNSFGNSSNVSGTSQSNNYTSPVSNNSTQQTSVYSSFSDVGASTIRGGTLNVVASIPYCWETASSFARVTASLASISRRSESSFANSASSTNWESVSSICGR